MKITFGLLFVATAATTGFSQKTTVGLEASVTSDRYTMYDSGGIMGVPRLLSASWGLRIAHDLSGCFTVESGVIRKYYQEGFEAAYNPGSGIVTNAFNTLQIPLKLRAGLPVGKFLKISTAVGYHFGINTDHTAWGTGSGTYQSSDSGDDSFAYTTLSNYRHARTFGLIETGLGLSVHLSDRVELSLQASRYSGLKSIATMDMHYSLNDGPTQTAQFTSNGGYSALTVGLSYAFCKRK